MGGLVAALHSSDGYTFSKRSQPAVTMLAGLGVAGDIHCGSTVRHRSRVAADPSQPNLRQVHLLPGELLDELRAFGFDVDPGQLGENVTTSGLDLHGLPTGTTLRFGDGALIALTGLRNPCGQIEGFSPGLLERVRLRGDDGEIVRRAGVMAVVLEGGEVRVGDVISVQAPPQPRRPLAPV